MTLTAKQAILFAFILAGAGLLIGQTLLIVMALGLLALRVLQIDQQSDTRIAAAQAEAMTYVQAIEREYSVSQRDHSQYNAGVMDALDTYAYITKTFQARAAYQQSGKRTVKIGYVGSTGVFMPCFVLARGKMTPLFSLPSMAPAPQPQPALVEPDWPDWRP